MTVFLDIGGHLEFQETNDCIGRFRPDLIMG